MSRQEPGQCRTTPVFLASSPLSSRTNMRSLVPPLQDDVVEDSMAVDVRHHRHFVCRRGQVLRELAEEYGGVAVSFPRTGANSQRVTLTGARDCVDAAKKRIQEMIEDLVRARSQDLF